MKWYEFKLFPLILFLWGFLTMCSIYKYAALVGVPMCLAAYFWWSYIFYNEEK